MYRILLAAFFVLLLTPATAVADDLPDSTEGTVVKVESGEVVVVQLAGSKKKVKVRVLGIDCSKGSRGATTRLAARKKVVLKSDKGFLPLLEDQFGRYVAYVQMTDGRDLGMELLKGGECSTADWKWPHPKTTQYASASR